MDGIVEQIYAAIQSQSHLQSTLLVLLGDHGMNDAGNHGGSAPGETSPALVFLSPKLKSLERSFQAPMATQEDFSYYSVVEQSDLAPTLGALLGFPVPKNNLGAFILDFLPLWPRGVFTPVGNMDNIQLLTKLRTRPNANPHAQRGPDSDHHDRYLWGGALRHYCQQRVLFAAEDRCRGSRLSMEASRQVLQH